VKTPACLLLILLLCLCVASPAVAQKENNIWMYGDKSGLDFNSGSPVPVTSAMVASEGTASICDADGRLLFYTNNEFVWDRTHQLMPNNGLTGGASSTQGVVIVPLAKRPGQYYLFSVESMERREYTFRYSMVDMSLNGGKGDIVSGIKNIKLGERMSEKIAVARACDGVWVITHHLDSPLFYAYPVSADGLIAAPVISKTNSTTIERVYLTGGMKLSNDFTKIVRTGFLGWQMFAFDAKSGTVAPEALLSQRTSWGWSFEFSPDNSKLYCSGRPVTQYDLSLLPDQAAVLASRYLIGDPGTDYPAVRKGPDSKIYFAEHRISASTSCINRPDSAGAACNPVLDIPALKHSNAVYVLSLGNDVVPAIQTQSFSESFLLCNDESIILHAKPGYDAYKWNDGDTAMQKEVRHNSRSWLESYRDGCPLRSDTFVTEALRFDLHLNDTVVCNGGLLRVKAGIDAVTDAANVRYLWQDGSADSSLTINKSGVYWVEVALGQCIRTDTMEVKFRNVDFELGADREICKGLSCLIRPQTGEAPLLWSDGSTGRTLSVNQTGLYFVTASWDGCTKTDSMRIDVVACDDCIAIPNAFTPNSDGRNDIFSPVFSCPVLRYSLHIFNRYGEQVFGSNNTGRGWDGTFKGRDGEIGTYYYFLKVLFNQRGAFETIYKGDVNLLR
jgi:gliding motility-associated-like protein